MVIVDKIRILWHKMFYDYPRSGICLYEGHKRYFKLINEVWERNPNYDEEKDNDIECEEEFLILTRIYGIYELLDDELAALEDSHNRFKEFVGTHTDYHENGDRTIADARPESEWHKYYDDPRNKIEIDCECRPAVALWIK